LQRPKPKPAPPVAPAPVSQAPLATPAAAGGPPLFSPEWAMALLEQFVEGVKGRVATLPWSDLVVLHVLLRELVPLLEASHAPRVAALKT
jgi:hypothetical protein